MITPPKPGEHVNILAPHVAQLRGQVTRLGPRSLTVELEQGPAGRPFRFVTGSWVSLEWVHALGTMQLATRVENDQLEPGQLLLLQLAGEPAPAERRETTRAPIELRVSAWTPAQASARLVGKTVDLSAGGALLSLRDLPLEAGTLELSLDLPGKPLDVLARVAWRRKELVGVEFGLIDAADRARLLELLKSAR